MAADIVGISGLSAMLGISLPILFLVLIWTLVWKALALWKAAKKNHLIWFILLLVINTLGILEILYIFLFSKINLNEKVKKIKKARKK